MSLFDDIVKQIERDNRSKHITALGGRGFVKGFIKIYMKEFYGVDTYKWRHVRMLFKLGIIKKEGNLWRV